MSGNRPRKHHFLPQMYLRGFCAADGALYVYERGKKPRQSRPDREATQRDLYGYETEDGLSFEYEEWLSSHESKVAGVIQGILEREDTKQRRLLTADETQTLREFVALVFTRGPAGFRYAEEHTGPAADKLVHQLATDKQEFDAEVRQYLLDSSVPQEHIEAALEVARQAILDGFFNQPGLPDEHLRGMQQVGSMIAREMDGYSCLIVVAPKHENYITSDMPVVTGRPEGVGMRLGSAFNDPLTHIWLPLSNKVCLVWSRVMEPGYAKLPPSGVRMANRNVMRFADRFVYASTCSEKLAEVFSRSEREKIVLGVNAFVPKPTI